jgi:hypothetical protein
MTRNRSPNSSRGSTRQQHLSILFYMTGRFSLSHGANKTTKGVFLTNFFSTTISRGAVGLCKLVYFPVRCEIIKKLFTLLFFSAFLWESSQHCLLFLPFCVCAAIVPRVCGTSMYPCHYCCVLVSETQARLCTPHVHTLFGVSKTTSWCVWISHFDKAGEPRRPPAFLSPFDDHPYWLQCHTAYSIRVLTKHIFYTTF